MRGACEHEECVVCLPKGDKHMHRRLIASFALVSVCAVATAFGWLPANAAPNGMSGPERIMAKGDGGTAPIIGQVGSDAGAYGEASARRSPVQWEAGPASTWEAGPGFALGDDGGL